VAKGKAKKCGPADEKKEQTPMPMKSRPGGPMKKQNMITDGLMNIARKRMMKK